MSATSREVRDKVLVIRIERPEASNAINSDVSTGLWSAFEELDGDDGLRVGVLAGRGPTFCAGMDLEEFTLHGTPKGVQSLIRRGVRKPLIAAVEGPALGGGLELALVADIIIATTDATFGLPEVRVGFFAGSGGLFRLPSRMPLGAVAELALTGTPISAERAHALGLVTRLAKPGRALDEALAVADVIAANAPLALAATKQLLRGAQDRTADEFWSEQHRLVSSVFRSEDAREGAGAFAERRAPIWRNR